MTAAMAAAMMLFARKQDSLLHVLASPEFEKSGKFFPDSADEASMLELREFPFVRLLGKVRGLKNASAVDYKELVMHAQENVDELVPVPVMTIDDSHRLLIIGDTSVSLSPLEFKLYSYYASSESFEPGGNNFPTRLKDLLQVPHDDDYGHKIIKTISQINRKIKTKLDEKYPVESYVISTDGIYGKSYGIRLPLQKRKWKKTHASKFS